MKKRMISMLMVGIMTLGSLTPVAFAKENNTPVDTYDIQSVDELEKEIQQQKQDGYLSNEEQRNLLSNTNPVVLDEYLEKEIDQIHEIFDENEFVLNDEESFKEYNMETDNGGELKIVLEDEPEPTSNSDGAPKIVSRAASNKTDTVNTTFKAIGNRYFTGSCYYQNGFVTIRFKLRNHYTVTSKQTLKKRYTAVDTLAGFSLYCNNRIFSTEWTHETATKVGSYINCRVGIASVVGVDIKGLPFKTTKYYYVNSRVKLLAKTTSGGKKGVKVQQSLQWTK